MASVSPTTRLEDRPSLPNSGPGAITIGITTFDRPAHLARCVESILRFYPAAEIVVADNGRERPKLPAGVRVVTLPYDAGLSASRNAVIDASDTEFVLIMEDDMLFTDETRLESFVEVLRADPEIGLVAGTLLEPNDPGPIRRLFVFDLFRDRLWVRPASSAPLRQAEGGTLYRVGDMVPNFFLARREFLNDHRWNDRLKLGEHLIYFWEVHQARRWRVAHTDAARIVHDRENRPDEYRRMRSRARTIRDQFARKIGLASIEFAQESPLTEPPVSKPLGEPSRERPNILVLGVGHSGTTILTRMLAKLGWNLGDADIEFAESVTARGINRALERGGLFPVEAAAEAIRRLPSPWVLKDPRFARTLDLWRSVFEADGSSAPLVVWIRRDESAVAASFKRRGAMPGRELEHVRRLYHMAQSRFENWHGPKVSFDYERIADAVRLFDPERAGRED